MPSANVPPRPERVAPVGLSRIAAVAGAPDTGTDTAVTGVTHDSRAVRPGDLYAALPGARVHGAAFAAEVASAGAVAALTDPAGADAVRAAGLVPVVVDDPRAVLGPVAAAVYGNPADGLLLLGTTGTNGKTTTSYLLEAGLRAAAHRTGLVGTVETRVGGEVLPSVRTTPEATDLQALFAVMRERGVAAAAMEVSSHALALGRVLGTTFRAVGFTGLSQDHLDFHRDLEDYFLAKAALFAPGYAPLGVVVADEPWGQRLLQISGIPVRSLTTTVAGDWQVSRVQVDAEGASHFELDGPAGRLAAAVALPGAFNVLNAALAIAMLVEAGVDAEPAVRGVSGVRAVPGRMERVDAGQRFLALVDYAHSPDAVERVLVEARRLAGHEGRVIGVLGCGGDRDADKRPLMGAALADGADIAVLTSDNPRSEDPEAILAAMQAGVTREDGVLVDPDRASAIRAAVRSAAPGDVVVILGKGHEQGQESGGTVTPFDDRDVLRQAIRELA
ncbi:MAG: UDP-N-acetylmuramoyl-L-alanyl-D-glutamate--2,6-diaminopimelate ligase [Frankiaceae bacterium]|nr:UDP-N-acetylmuramoyl-L-alanyl-D-glutamate--2,6-diaminopimelate ligase [Frankiaceae bacterium]